jgi:hypothetical protein
MQTRCGECNAKLNVRDDLAGKRARCPNCKTELEIPSLEESKPPIPPATEKQKKFALELGIECPAGINRRDISTLIDEALGKANDDRCNQLDDLSNRESEAYQRMYAEVVAAADRNDPRLSQASTDQICEALSERGLSAVLITATSDEISGFDFEGMQGASTSVAFTDDMDIDEMYFVVKLTAAQLNLMHQFDAEDDHDDY